MGLAASKKWQESKPVKIFILLANLFEVNGPVAITVIFSLSGRSSCSILSIWIRGWVDNVFVNDLLNFDLSTAKAPPAGTENLSAVCIIKELKVLNSSCNKPAALSGLRAPKLLLQTNSANSLVWWAGVELRGLISTSFTAIPELAICQAASQPASPAPITTICLSIKSN